MTLPLVLASTSVFRRELLTRLTSDFCQDSPNVDEAPLSNESAPQLAERLAINKAQALASLYPQHLIIGSDQVASFNNQLIGKPHTHENAIQQLLTFSGQRVDFYTGLCLFNSQTQQLQSSVEVFSVFFRVLTPQQIENYLYKEQPYQCAGSFKSEGLGICLFEKMQGDDPTSLIGLPLMKLVTFLKNEDYQIV
ncbi:MAG TPA: nucleoside triphosphate pyrophosphatase [Agitococcus sp.]|uniref:Maf family protein n=1 Tax=uncultured Agitococcus sp. TaxID=1506599 RepID=UPI002624A751|nr:nucleoside triphosphate pyrophosphatase [uncultured Agitococcus sp.]HNE90983.1 nucleoside triphosphate pyrophosphatase [Agitococcus sp.]HRH91571.1 nucleoside triphosphate pyrophosphatase [Agitococcus sp.]